MRPMVAPAHPSNRRFIDQCELWGCQELRTRNGWAELRAPTGTKFRVRSAHTHTGNSRRTMAEAIEAIGVNHVEFWKGPLQVTSIAIPTPVDEEPELAEPEPEPDPNEQRRQSGLANMVLDQLIASDVPLSITTLAERTGFHKGSVSGACSYLVKLGLLDRVKSGVYQAKKEYTPKAAAPEPPPEPEPEPEPPAQPTVESIEDEVNTVLDLLFPSGMNVRASDLRLINDWIDATKALLRKVRS